MIERKKFSAMCERLMRGIINGEVNSPSLQPNNLRFARSDYDLFSVHIVNIAGDELVRVAQFELDVNDSYTITDIHRSFEITLRNE